MTGSFKFDVARRNAAKEEELRAWLAANGVREGAKAIVGGSTWPGEDEILLETYKRLLETENVNGQLVLVIAPRHFEKADAVDANVRKAGFECVRRSRGDSSTANPSTLPLFHSSTPVFLADTTGELMGLYGIADAVFVGKSLCAHGAQNMIEPCLCGKPTAVEAEHGELPSGDERPACGGRDSPSPGRDRAGAVRPRCHRRTHTWARDAGGGGGRRPPRSRGAVRCGDPGTL